MAEFAHPELDLACQPWYLPLVSMGSTLDQWPGSCIFGNCEVTSLYTGILTLRLCHFEPRSCRWPKAGWESLQTNTTAATALEFHTLKVLGPIYVWLHLTLTALRNWCWYLETEILLRNSGVGTRTFFKFALCTLE